ncbi:MAG: PEP-CTERM sorting domain-containing protein [Planctomycetes bacterium]|nr:PEP-CTERM sorting domain-containing protein [Planctomycetota bacterium]
MKYTAIAILLLCCAPAFAGPVDCNQGSMELWIQPNGEGQLVNVSDETVYFDGYEITSYNSLLSPSGWITIEGLIADGQEALVASILGEEALDFEVMGQSSVHTRVMSECNIHGWGALQPGDRWSLGVIASQAMIDDMRFRYCCVIPGEGGTVTVGGWMYSPVAVPEPATLCLLGLGAAAALRRRR